MTEDVRYRPANAGDVAGVQRVADDAWHTAYDDILGADVVETMLDEWYEDDAIEAGVEHEAQDFFVAVVDGEVVGYAHAGPHPPRRVHQVYRLYVDPDHWREGIGRNLVAEVEQALYDRDVTAYEAEVLAGNDRGVAFYEAVGFERVDEQETDFAGTTATEYIFQKRL
ncbi:N-acetyltransferase family protein [Halosimplex halobium]|uniref:GNAT family N-acetyltransferase n=1 Tax=Halosimplex halobium TaxID=3396618 RepID=UPI003F56B796